MDTDTALFYLGVQTYKAMQAEEAAAQKMREIEELKKQVEELTQKEGGTDER